MRSSPAKIICVVFTVLAAGCGNRDLHNNVDLRASACSGPMSAAAGSVIAVTDGVTNDGGAGSAAFKVGVYLSADKEISPATDTLIRSRDIVQLFGGEESVEAVDISIPADTTPGTYWLGVVADYEGAAMEETKANNTLVSWSSITITAASTADLQMTSVSGPASTPRNADISVSTTAENAGTGAAGPFVVSVYLSEDDTITVGDRLLGSRVVASLAGGASDSQDMILRIGPDVWTGTYYIGAIADPVGGVDETDETNNGMVSATPITVGILPSPDSYEPDDSETMATPLVLDGPSQDHTFHVVSDKDWYKITVAGSTGIRLEVTNVTGLSLIHTYMYLTNGDYSSIYAYIYPWEFVLPEAGTYLIKMLPSMETGTYTVALKSTTTTMQRDFYAHNVNNGQQGVLPGGTITCYGYYSIITNTYIPPTKISYYLSVDTLPGADDVLLGSNVMYGTTGMTAVNVTRNCPIPANTAPGVYRIIQVVDPDSEISEANEANNWAVNLGLIYVSPDVATNSVTAPASVDTGQQMSVNWDIGATPAGYRAPLVKFYISTDTALDAADVLLGSIASVSGTGSASFRIPGGLPAGTYHVIMAVNPEHAYAETSYSNNTAVSGDVTVVAVPFPDITATAVSCSPLITVRQATVTLTDTVVNSGHADAGTFKVSYYLFADTDAGKMRGRILIGQRTLASLAQGAQDNGSGPYQLPAGVYAGIYHLAAVVDLADEVVEENETNNTFVSADIVYIQGANLSEGWDNYPYSAVYLDWQGFGGAPLCNMTISGPGDVDWVQFWAGTGQTLRLETEQVTAGLSTVMELWTCDSNRNPITMLAIDSGSGGGPGCSAIVHTFTKNGTYLLRIYCRDPSATGAYWVTGKLAQ